MTLSRFIDYLYKAGSPGGMNDATYRAYDLLIGMSPVRTKKALAYLGIYVPEPSLAMMELAARMGSRGLVVDNIPPDELALVLCEWYIWQRLEDGDLRRWPKRG